jgi:hypothetical protein
MSGLEDRSDALFLQVSLDSFVPADHSLRPIRKMADKALASLTGEFEGAATDMIKNIPGTRRVTVGAGKGYDTEGFVATLRSMSATPHVAQN